MNSDNAMPAIYSLARSYSQHFSGLSKMLVKYRPYICPFDIILKHIPNHSRVFDIGCGAGFFLNVCHQFTKPARLAGVDSDDTKIKEAKTIAHKLYPEHYCDFFHSPPSNWPDETFDVALMIDVLHHIPKTALASFILAAADRVADNGLLIIKDMTRTPRWMANMNRLHDLLIARQWINLIDPLWLTNFLAERGFSQIARERSVQLWYSHEMLVLRKI